MTAASSGPGVPSTRTTSVSAGDNAEVNSVALWRIYERHFLKFDEHKGVKLLTIYTHGPGIFWNARRPIRSSSLRTSLGLSVAWMVCDRMA